MIYEGIHGRIFEEIADSTKEIDTEKKNLGEMSGQISEGTHGGIIEDTSGGSIGELPDPIPGGNFKGFP